MQGKEKIVSAARNRAHSRHDFENDLKYIVNIFQIVLEMRGDILS